MCSNMLVKLLGLAAAICPVTTLPSHKTCIVTFGPLRVPTVASSLGMCLCGGAMLQPFAWLEYSLSYQPLSHL